jgi:hypothetical protein
MNYSLIMTPGITIMIKSQILFSSICSEVEDFMDNWEQYTEKAFTAERSGNIDGDNEAELTDIAIKLKADIVFKPDENGYLVWPDIDINSIKLLLLKDTI